MDSSVPAPAVSRGRRSSISKSSLGAIHEHTEMGSENGDDAVASVFNAPRHRSPPSLVDQSPMDFDQESTAEEDEPPPRPTLNSAASLLTQPEAMNAPALPNLVHTQSLAVFYATASTASLPGTPADSPIAAREAPEDPRDKFLRKTQQYVSAFTWSFQNPLTRKMIITFLNLAKFQIAALVQCTTYLWDNDLMVAWYDHFVLLVPLAISLVYFYHFQSEIKNDYAKQQFLRKDKLEAEVDLTDIREEVAAPIVEDAQTRFVQPANKTANVEGVKATSDESKWAKFRRFYKQSRVDPKNNDFYNKIWYSIRCSTFIFVATCILIGWIIYGHRGNWSWSPVINVTVFGGMSLLPFAQYAWNKCVVLDYVVYLLFGCLLV